MEKAALLKQVTEPKIGSSVADLLGGLRQWRRLLGRAAELRLALPDPIVLATVLGRMADSLVKHGGHQMGYRISGVRQELMVDIRPTMEAIRDFAEVLQAEAEELALSTNAKMFSTVPTAAPVLKALQTDEWSRWVYIFAGVDELKGPLQVLEVRGGMQEGFFVHVPA